MAVLEEDVEAARQEAILEFIQTELTYLNRLIIVQRLFRDGLKGGLMSEEELTICFQNIDELAMIAGALKDDLVRLQVEQQLNKFSQPFIQHQPAMANAFRTYCLGHRAASSLLARLLEDGASKAGKYIQEASQHESCTGLGLSSFLLEPVQRLTRYPLLFKQILHYTPKSHVDLPGTIRALELAESMLAEINETVRETENKTRLIELQDAIEWKGDGVERVDLLAETRELGPRQVRHEGVLTKVDFLLKKRINLHLFNDLLLMTTGIEPRLRIYRQPIPISQLTVEWDGEMITIGSTLQLKAMDEYAAQVWVEEINRAISDYKPMPAGSRRTSRRPSIVGIGTIKLQSLNAVGLPPVKGIPTLRSFVRTSLNGQVARTAISTSLQWPTESIIMAVLRPEDVLEVEIWTERSYGANVLLAKGRMTLDMLEYYAPNQRECIELPLVPGGVLNFDLQFRSLQ